MALILNGMTITAEFSGDAGIAGIRLWHGADSGDSHGRRSEAPFPHSIRKSGEGAEAVCRPETGLWHTVIDDPDTYLELSASAAFLRGIMQG